MRDGPVLPSSCRWRVLYIICMTFYVSFVSSGRGSNLWPPAFKANSVSLGYWGSTNPDQMTLVNRLNCFLSFLFCFFFLNIHVTDSVEHLMSASATNLTHLVYYQVILRNHCVLQPNNEVPIKVENKFV